MHGQVGHLDQVNENRRKGEGREGHEVLKNEYIRNPEIPSSSSPMTFSGIPQFPHGHIDDQHQVEG